MNDKKEYVSMYAHYTIGNEKLIKKNSEEMRCSLNVRLMTQRLEEATLCLNLKKAVSRNKYLRPKLTLTENNRIFLNKSAKTFFISNKSHIFVSLNQRLMSGTCDGRPLVNGYCVEYKFKDRFLGGISRKKMDFITYKNEK